MPKDCHQCGREIAVHFTQEPGDDILCCSCETANRYESAAVELQSRFDASQAALKEAEEERNRLRLTIESQKDAINDLRDMLLSATNFTQISAFLANIPRVDHHGGHRRGYWGEDGTENCVWLVGYWGKGQRRIDPQRAYLYRHEAEDNLREGEGLYGIPARGILPRILAPFKVGLPQCAIDNERYRRTDQTDIRAYPWCAEALEAMSKIQEVSRG